MVRSVTVFDEDFTDDDMAAALAWQSEQRLTCSCGFPLDETTAKGRDEAYDVELVTCHVCATADRAIRSHQRDGGDTAG